MARRADRNQRGSNLVEAAIILPVVMLLTFGAIDFGIGFNQKSGLDNAGRAGTRLGATETDQDNASATVVPGQGTIPAHTQIGFFAGGAVNAALSQISSSPQLVEMFVFRSAWNGSTWVPSSVTRPADCSTDCIMYTADPAKPSQFKLYDTPVGQWPGTPTNNWADRNVCNLNADRIGITVIADYHYLSGLVGSTTRLTSTSTAQLEPTVC